MQSNWFTADLCPLKVMDCKISVLLICSLKTRHINRSILYFIRLISNSSFILKTVMEWIIRI